MSLLKSCSGPPRHRIERCPAQLQLGREAHAPPRLIDGLRSSLQERHLNATMHSRKADRRLRLGTIARTAKLRIPGIAPSRCPLKNQSTLSDFLSAQPGIRVNSAS